MVFNPEFSQAQYAGCPPWFDPHKSKSMAHQNKLNQYSSNILDAYGVDSIWRDNYSDRRRTYPVNSYPQMKSVSLVDIPTYAPSFQEPKKRDYGDYDGELQRKPVYVGKMHAGITSQEMEGLAKQRHRRYMDELTWQVEEKNRLEKECKEREAYEELLMEENIKRQQEAIKREYEDELGRKKRKENERQKRRDAHFNYLERLAQEKSSSKEAKVDSEVSTTAVGPPKQPYQEEDRPLPSKISVKPPQGYPDRDINGASGDYQTKQAKANVNNPVAFAIDFGKRRKVPQSHLDPNAKLNYTAVKGKSDLLDRDSLKRRRQLDMKRMRNQTSSFPGNPTIRIEDTTSTKDPSAVEDPAQFHHSSKEAKEISVQTDGGDYMWRGYDSASSEYDWKIPLNELSEEHRKQLEDDNEKQLQELDELPDLMSKITAIKNKLKPEDGNPNNYEGTNTEEVKESDVPKAPWWMKEDEVKQDEWPSYKANLQTEEDHLNLDATARTTLRHFVERSTKNQTQ